MKVSMCILTYNRSDYLRSLLSSLSEVKYNPLDIIVVDNHSDDNTANVVRDEFPYVNYFRTDWNMGAGARNIGMKAAAGDIIITLDDDISGINDDAIEYLVRLFSDRPTLGAVNCKVYNPATHQICNWVHHCDPDEWADKEFLTYEITEGAVAFRKQALERVGYYPEEFFLSHEGPDLGMRMLDGGFDVIYSGQIMVKHYMASSGRKPWRNYYYDTRNQVWVAARNFPFSYAVRYLLRGWIAMLVYSVRDGYLRYWVRGVWDGVMGMGKALEERRVLGKETMALIRQINGKRPGLGYYIEKRLMKRGFGV